MSESTALAAATPMSLIQTAIEKGMAVENLGKLMDLQERYERNEAAKEFALAIADFQSKMPAVVKGNPVNDKNGNLMYTFASFDDIMAIAQPILSARGITVTFSTKVTPEKLMETTCHVRVGIHVEHTSITLALPSIPNANDAQKAGAALAYGQRYSMKAALNIRISGEDTDAAKLAETVNEQQAQRIDNLIERRLSYPVPEMYVTRLFKWAGAPEGGKAVDIPAEHFQKVVDELERQIASEKKKVGAK